MTTPPCHRMSPCRDDLRPLAAIPGRLKDWRVPSAEADSLLKHLRNAALKRRSTQKARPAAALRSWVRTVPSLKGLGSIFHFTPGLAPRAQFNAAAARLDLVTGLLFAGFPRKTAPHSGEIRPSSFCGSTALAARHFAAILDTTLRESAAKSNFSNILPRNTTYRRTAPTHILLNFNGLRFSPDSAVATNSLFHNILQANLSRSTTCKLPSQNIPNKRL